jgi:hypothetical protein
MSDRKLISYCLYFSLFVLLLTAFLIVGAYDLEDEINQEILYCEQVQLFSKTDGRYGWPNYNPSIKCKTHSIARG